MPWRAVKPMDEKIQFVSYALEGSRSFSSICDIFGISRKTGYKWLNRYSLSGAGALNEERRGPKVLEKGSRASAIEHILEVRRSHPAWGAPKIIAYLKNHGFKSLPSVSTCGRILQRNGLIKKSSEDGFLRLNPSLTQAIKPNDVWTVDYKGDFVLADKIRCYPLTISDRFSRYLLCCEGFQRTSFEEAQQCFKKTFKKYGLPSIIRSDNGVPFSSATGLSRLAVWWIDLGIRPEVIDPGKPYQNGQHERMHRALKDEVVDLNLTFLAQKKKLKEYVSIYNYLRPHEALLNKVPSDLYCSSVRKFSEKIQSWDYHSQAALKVDARGNIYFKGKRHFISHALKFKYVGVDEVDTDLWMINYRDYPMRYIDLGIGKM